MATKGKYRDPPRQPPWETRQLSSRVESSQVKSSQTKLNQAKPSQVKSSRAKLSRAKPSQAKSGQVKSSQVKSSQAKSSEAEPSQVKSSQAKSSQAKKSQVKSSHVKPSQAEPSQALACRVMSCQVVPSALGGGAARFIQAKRLVVPHRDEPAAVVRVKGHSPHLLRVAIDNRLQQASRREVPDADGAVGGARGEARAVGRDTQTEHPRRVTLE